MSPQCDLLFPNLERVHPCGPSPTASFDASRSGSTAASQLSSDWHDAGPSSHHSDCGGPAPFSAPLAMPGWSTTVTPWVPFKRSGSSVGGAGEDAEALPQRMNGSSNGGVGEAVDGRWRLTHSHTGCSAAARRSMRPAILPAGYMPDRDCANISPGGTEAQLHRKVTAGGVRWIPLRRHIGTCRDNVHAARVRQRDLRSCGARPAREEAGAGPSLDHSHELSYGAEGMACDMPERWKSQEVGGHSGRVVDLQCCGGESPRMCGSRGRMHEGVAHVRDLWEEGSFSSCADDVGPAGVRPQWGGSGRSPRPSLEMRTAAEEERPSRGAQKGSRKSHGELTEQLSINAVAWKNQPISMERAHPPANGLVLGGWEARSAARQVDVPVPSEADVEQLSTAVRRVLSLQGADDPGREASRVGAGKPAPEQASMHATVQPAEPLHSTTAAPDNMDCRKAAEVPTHREKTTSHSVSAVGAPPFPDCAGGNSGGLVEQSIGTSDAVSPNGHTRQPRRILQCKKEALHAASRTWSAAAIAQARAAAAEAICAAQLQSGRRQNAAPSPCAPSPIKADGSPMRWRSKLPAAQTAPPLKEAYPDGPAERTPDAVDADAERSQSNQSDVEAAARPTVGSPEGKKLGLGSGKSAAEPKQKVTKAACKSLTAQQKTELSQGAGAATVRVGRSQSEAQARLRAQRVEVSSVSTPPHFKSLPFCPTGAGRGKCGKANDDLPSQQLLPHAISGKRSGLEALERGDLQAGTAAAVSALIHDVCVDLLPYIEMSSSCG